MKVVHRDCSSKPGAEFKRVPGGGTVLDNELRRCEGCDERILFNPYTKGVRFL